MKDRPRTYNLIVYAQSSLRHVRALTRISFFAFILFLFLIGCKKDNDAPVRKAPALNELNADLAIEWADMTLYVIRYSAFNTPTYSSRSLGYLGLCMYETIVRGDASRRS